MPDDTYRPKLPVLKIVLRSYIFTFQSYVTFLKWLLPAILIVTIIEIPISSFFEEYKILPGILITYILYMVYWPVSVIIIRNILLGETDVPRYLSVLSKYYYWQYVLADLLVGFLVLFSAAIPFIFIMYLDIERTGHINLAVFVFILLAMIIVGRFWLVLPMKAVGHDGWAVRSWRISKGNTLQIATILLLINIVPYVFVRIVRILFDYIGDDDRALIFILFNTIENFVANTLIGVLDLSLNACALAYAYRVLTETKPNEQV